MAEGGGRDANELELIRLRLNTFIDSVKGWKESLNEDMTIGDHISDEQEVLEEKPYKVTFT